MFLSLVMTLIFLMAIPYATNYTVRNKSVLSPILLAVILMVFLCTQSKFQKVHESDFIGSKTKQEALVVSEEKQEFLTSMCVTPARFNFREIEHYPRLISATFLQTGVADLVMNLCFLWIFSIALESILGRWKFSLFVLLAAILPMMLNTLVSEELGYRQMERHGGLSGLIFCFAGGWFLCCWRGRVHLASVTESGFWYIYLLMFVPISILASIGSRFLGESVLIASFVAIYLAKSPTTYTWAAAPIFLLVFKFLEDVIMSQSIGEIVYSSPVLAICGFVCGLAGTYALMGNKKLRQVWDGMPEHAGPLFGLPLFRKKANAPKRLTLAQLAQDAYIDEAKAKLYLGQRVFVGDGDKVEEFYKFGVMKKYPDLMLDPRDQITLCRILNFRDLPKEALHAYEKLVNLPEVPDHMKEVWYQSALLLFRTDSSRMRMGLGYLDRYFGYELNKREFAEARKLKNQIMDSLGMPVLDEESYKSKEVYSSQTNDDLGDEVQTAAASTVFNGVEASPIPVTDGFRKNEVLRADSEVVPEELIERMKIFKKRNEIPVEEEGMPRYSPSTFDSETTEFRDYKKREPDTEPTSSSWNVTSIQTLSVDDFVKKRRSIELTDNDGLGNVLVSEGGVPNPIDEQASALLYKEVDPFAAITVKPRGRASWLEVTEAVQAGGGEQGESGVNGDLIDGDENRSGNGGYGIAIPRVAMATYDSTKEKDNDSSAYQSS